MLKPAIVYRLLFTVLGSCVLLRPYKNNTFQLLDKQSSLTIVCYEWPDVV